MKHRERPRMGACASKPSVVEAGETFNKPVKVRNYGHQNWMEVAVRPTAMCPSREIPLAAGARRLGRVLFPKLPCGEPREALCDCDTGTFRSEGNGSGDGAFPRSRCWVIESPRVPDVQRRWSGMSPISDVRWLPHAGLAELWGTCFVVSVGCAVGNQVSIVQC